ncbi:MAG: hypothetical protein HGB18_01505 [Candidatus Moranbacteria bacterium]|nr:hypothetical protein [Candidatus Moranbacteria bacterium]
MNDHYSRRLAAFLTALRRSGIPASPDSVNGYSLRYPANGPPEAFGFYYPFRNIGACTIALIHLIPSKGIRIDFHSFADRELSPTPAADTIVRALGDLICSALACVRDMLERLRAIIIPNPFPITQTPYP